MEAGAEVLNQDEIDALLKGVDNSEVRVEAGASVPGEVRPYDMTTQVRIVRGRMPAFEMINERFARSLRISLFNMIRRNPEISVAPIQLVKYSEFLQTLRLPASLNLVKLPPLRGTGLIVLDGRMVFAVVDNFFGGTGRNAEIEGRDITVTESRIVQMVLRQAFVDLQEAWAPVHPLKVEYLNTETNPHFANFVSASEVVVVTSFKIGLEGGGGELHMALPYSMIEPIRELLDSGMQSDQNNGNLSWMRTLSEDVKDVNIEVVPLLGQTTLTVGQVLNLKPGDVIPCDFDGQATLLVEGLPFLRGTYGASRGQQAIKVADQIARRGLAHVGEVAGSAQ
jgi:flagellar motor switch protein FliM